MSAAEGAASAELEGEPPLIEVAAHVVFGHAGNAARLQLEGWSMPEPGYAWSIGKASRTRIPYRTGNGTMMIELTVSPNLHKSVVREQQLIVLVNGTIVGNELIDGETTLGFEVPAGALGESGEMIVTLQHPNAFRPAKFGVNPDDRELGFSVRDMLLLWVPPEPPFTKRSRPPLPVAPDSLDAGVRFFTALTTADLMNNFESLGHNCEFGLAQRAAGAEPLGLLRFGGLAMHNLLRGLDYSFAGIEDPARLHAYTERGRRGEEYLVRDENYGVAFHTFQTQGETTPEAVVEKFGKHLAFLRRHFQEVLETSVRIFVIQHPALRTQAHVLPILNLLRSHGPNVLLYVTQDVLQPDGTHRRVLPPGSVEQERADLFHGYIDEFAPIYAADKLNLFAWINICANTYRMWREQGGGAT